MWGLQRDPAMAETVAASEAAVVIMHNRAEKDRALDIVADMRRFFDRSLALAAKAGIPDERIILDPGIGFAKTSQQNIEAVRRLGELHDYGRPILVGVSRKKFLGPSIGGRHGRRADRNGRRLSCRRSGGRITVPRARRRRARRGAEGLPRDPRRRLSSLLLATRELLLLDREHAVLHLDILDDAGASDLVDEPGVVACRP